LNKKPLILYLLRFVLCFFVLYFGTKALIGITAPGGFYWAFADDNLNYVAALRSLLMHSSQLLLQALGISTYLKDIFTIRMQGGIGVHVVYSCLGYGVMSFWIAFVFANSGTFKEKFIWMLVGILTIFLINVGRISLMLVAVNKRWASPLHMDNHTWFNIAAYTAIFFLMWLFDKSKRRIDRAAAR
jgi:exosortase/archaeosortase family protein